MRKLPVFCCAPDFQLVTRQQNDPPKKEKKKPHGVELLFFVRAYCT